MAGALAAALGGSVQDGTTVVVERESVSLRVEPFEKAEHHPAWARVSAQLAMAPGGSQGPYRDDGRARVSGRPDLELRLRGGDDAPGRLGPDHPLVADATAFARAVVVESAAPPEIVSATLASPETRGAVLGLLRAGCPEIKLHAAAGTLSVTVRAGSLEPIAAQDELIAAVDRALPLLADLRAALPLFSPGGPTWRGRVIDWLGPLLGFVVVVGGVVLTLVGMLRWEPEGSGPFRLAAYLGLPLWALVVPLVFLLARGRPGWPRTFALTVVPLLLGLPAFVAGAATMINAKLDRGPATVHAVEILRKETRSARNGTRHLLHLQSWRPGPSEVLEVSPKEHAAAREGQKVQIRVRAGRLGWRWVEGWELPH